ncbi:MAG: phosphate ABC transporter permease PstA [Chitinophagaceae bacterium]|nr:phosphate ABC transporter permease PstA [Anaerolineae bacterium]
MASTLLSLVVLIILLLSIIDQAFGLVAVKYDVEPEVLAGEGRTLNDLNSAELAAVLAAPYTELANNRETSLSDGVLRSIVLNGLIGTVDPARLGTDPLNELYDGIYTEEVGAKTYGELSREDVVTLLAENAGETELRLEILTRIANRRVLKGWGLFDSLLNRSRIQATIAAAAEADPPTELAGADLEFRSWITSSFFTESMSRQPELAGIRSGVIGTLWVVGITMLIAVPVGVGAATYLEEYAEDTFFNRLIEINIRNLAGVPSIIYGLLGLAIFANAFRSFTSGDFLEGAGGQPSSGNTILTASLTMALLILPYIIATAQEAIRAVPYAYREASYGLGATKWQTVSKQVLPAALPGIITGIILSLSRAIGETAPLVVVGAAVFLSQDPSGPFSQFTVLPIQIYNWIKESDPNFRFTASAGIIVLMAMALTLNSFAIILRNRLTRRI